MGGALAIRLDGKPVVDLWGGVARPQQQEGGIWEADTLSVIFSCTKGLTSILAARLVQDGLLDYHALVTDYWPEFGAAGKGSTRVKDLLAHRSGLSAPLVALTRQQMMDWDLVVSQLAAQNPIWTPGTGHAYHAITHGWLIGEVIRRVTGQTVGDYFANLVATPLGADAWIGLPSGLTQRVATMRVGSTLAEFLAEQARKRTPGVLDLVERAMTLGGALPEALVGPGIGFNDPEVQGAELPGAGGIATARALATIWSATIVETEGVRLLDNLTVDAATAEQSSGSPVIFDVPPPWPRWGMGFQLDGGPRRYLTTRGFGHDGAGGQATFADPGAGIGFAYLTNQMEEGTCDSRATSVIDALRRALDIDPPGVG